MQRRKGLKRSQLERGSELKVKAEKVREFMQRGRAADRPPVVKICETCGKRFKISSAAAERGEGRYCSRGCWPRTEYVARRCENCGKPFKVEKRRVERNPQHGRFCSRACANGPRVASDGRRRPHTGSQGQRGRFTSGQKRCVHPDCKTPRARAHEHHVVYEQHVRREGGDIHDPRNALRLCVGCHSSHHRRGSRIVPLSALRDENYEFAFELLGAAAEIYLRRRYSGEDPRLADWVRRVEAAAASSGDETRGGSDGEA